MGIFFEEQGWYMEATTTALVSSGGGGVSSSDGLLELVLVLCFPILCLTADCNDLRRRW